MSTQQEQFDEEYITSSEIYRELGVTRPALHFRRKSGKIPEGIQVGQQLMLWKRAEIMPYLEEWKQQMAHPRGVPV